MFTYQGLPLISCHYRPGNMEECECRNVPVGLHESAGGGDEPLYLVWVDQLWVSAASAVQEIHHPGRLLTRRKIKITQRESDK